MLDHGSNSGKRFSKWPPEAILKNLYVYMYIFCSRWPIWMIKLSVVGFLRCWIDWKGFWNNLKWGSCKIQNFRHSASSKLILLPSWFIISTGSSPCARIGPCAPPLLSMSGTILISGLLWMILTMLPEKNWGAMGSGHFSKLHGAMII